jgi:decaprenylphospho-beta-D-ribofuranose 2-oxidase
MPGRTVRLTGWGRVSPTSAELASPATVTAAAEVLARGTAARGAGARQYSGVIARGLGRSYNNAAQVSPSPSPP